MTAGGGTFVAPLSVQRLKKAFGRAIAAQTLGGSDVLFDLAGLARLAFRELAGGRMVVAYALAGLFAALYEDRKDRPVHVNEDAPLYAQAHPLISLALALLDGSSDTDNPLELACELIDLQKEIIE